MLGSGNLRYVLVYSAAFAATLWLVTAQSSAVQSQDQPMSFTVEGKIQKLEESKFSLNTEDNIIFHVCYDAKTEFKREGGEASAKDLKSGVKVKVEGDLMESGEIVAKTIEFEPVRAKSSP